MPVLLRQLQDCPEADVLGPPGAPQYIADVLGELFGPEAKDFMNVTGISVRAPQVVVPSIAPYCDLVKPEEAALLGVTFINGPAPQSGARNSVLRSGAPKRSRDGEAEFEAELAPACFGGLLHGETCFHRSRSPHLAQQETIVAPDGVGIANPIRARPAAHMVEVFPESLLNNCYALPAASLGLDYDYAICAPGDRGGVVPIAPVLRRKGTRSRT